MRNLKRICALVLSLLIGVSTLTTTGFAYEGEGGIPDPDNYTDIKGHWAEAALRNAISNGIMNGISDTEIDPDRNITRAEMATLMVRTFEATKTAAVNAFVDMAGSEWYYNYMARAVQMGIVSGSGNAMHPNEAITHEEAAIVFCRAFNLYGYTANLNSYSDAHQVSTYAQDAVKACVGAGVMGGAGGMLSPQAPLTRAEFTQMIYHLVQYYATSRVSFGSGNINGSLMLTVPNVTLTQANISGNLYLGDGVENGEITLDGTRVSGTIYVRGGSKVVLRNNSSVGAIVVYNPSYAVSVEIDRTSSVRETVIDTAINAVTVSGNCGDVTMNTASAVLNLKKAKVGTLTSNVMLPTITIDSDTTVEKMNLDENALGAKVTVEGKVNNMDMMAAEMEVTLFKDSYVKNVNIDGEAGEFTFQGDVENLVVGDNANDNKITIDSSAIIDKVEIGAGSGNEYNINGSADIDNFVVNTDRADVNLKITAPEFVIDSNAHGSRVTFDSGSDIDTLIVAAADTVITVDRRATVGTIEVSNRYITITGRGEVTDVILKPGAQDITVETANTKITNNSGTTVMVNGIELKDGEVAVLDENGKLEIDPSTKKADESILNISYAGKAEAADIEAAGGASVQITQLCTGITFNPSTGELGGIVKHYAAMPRFQSYNVGYYIPFVLDSRDMKETFTLRVGQVTYTRADVRGYGNYIGKLVFLLPVDAAVTDKSIEVAYDADGTGTEFNEVKQTLKYSSVLFQADTGYYTRAALIAGAAGIGGAESIAVGSSNVTEEVASYVMTATGLLKTANPNGTEGYWGGIKFVGPADAVSASYVVTIGGASNAYSATLATESLGGNTYMVFNHYEDLESVKQMSVNITWRNSGGTILGTSENYAFDFNGVTLVGTEGPADPDNPENPDNPDNPENPDNPPESNAIVTSAKLSAAAETWVASLYGKQLSDFAVGYNVATVDGKGYMAGTFKRVSADRLSEGYYLPARLEVTGLPAGTLAGVSVSGTQLDSLTGTDTGEAYVDIMVPLSTLGSSVKDFTIVITDTSGTKESVSFEVTSEAGSARVDDAIISIGAVDASASGAFFGQAFGALVDSGYAVIKNGTGYDLRGQYKVATLNDTASITNKTGWFAPISITDLNGAATTWSIKVQCDASSLTYNFGVGETVGNVLIPMAYRTAAGDSTYNSVTVTVSEGGTAKAAFVLSLDSTQFIDYQEGTEVNPGAGDTSTVSVAVPSGNFSVDGKSLDAMVSGAISVSNVNDVLTAGGGGKLLKYSESSGASTGEGFWYLPVDITVTNVKQSCKAVVTCAENVSGITTNGSIDTTSNGKIQVCIPVAYADVLEVEGQPGIADDKLYSNVQLSVYVDDATLAAATYSISVSKEYLKDFAPRGLVIVQGDLLQAEEAAQKAFSCDGKSYDDFVNSDGKLIKVSGEDGAYGWYLPAQVVLISAPENFPASVTITVNADGKNSTTAWDTSKSICYFLIPIAAGDSSTGVDRIASTIKWSVTSGSTVIVAEDTWSAAGITADSLDGFTAG